MTAIEWSVCICFLSCMHSTGNQKTYVLVLLATAYSLTGHTFDQCFRTENILQIRISPKYGRCYFYFTNASHPLLCCAYKPLQHILWSVTKYNRHSGHPPGKILLMSISKNRSLDFVQLMIWVSTKDNNLLIILSLWGSKIISLNPKRLQKYILMCPALKTKQNTVLFIGY